MRTFWDIFVTFSFFVWQQQCIGVTAGMLRLCNSQERLLSCPFISFYVTAFRVRVTFLSHEIAEYR